MPAAANRQSARTSHVQRAGEQAEAGRPTRTGERKKEENKPAAGGSSIISSIISASLTWHRARMNAAPEREGERRGKQLIAPRSSTRTTGREARRRGERAAGRYEMTTGGNGMGQASTQGTAPATSPDAHGSHVQDERTTPLPLSISPYCRHHESSSTLPPPTRYHIARTRKAIRSRPQHDIAPLDDMRSGAGGEARRYDTRDGMKGEAGKQRSEAA